MQIIKQWIVVIVSLTLFACSEDQSKESANTTTNITSADMAGENEQKVKTAISTDNGIAKQGVVTDLHEVELAFSFNWVAGDSSAMWVSYCDEQRELIKNFKERLYELRKKAYARNIGEVLQVTAADFYDLAAEAQNLAEGLPANDEQICL